MKVLLIDADNLSSSAWIEEACKVLEATEGTLAVRRPMTPFSTWAKK